MSKDSRCLRGLLGAAAFKVAVSGSLLVIFPNYDTGRFRLIVASQSWWLFGRCDSKGDGVEAVD